MVDISNADRQRDAELVEELLREDAELVEKINSGECAPQTSANRRREQIIVELLTIAGKYVTNYIDATLPAIIRQEPLPVSLE